MTKKKKAKRAVRARAERTGRSYAATLQATKPKEEPKTPHIELYFQTREEAAEKAISIMMGNNSAYEAFAADNPEEALSGIALASSSPEDPEYLVTWPIFDRPFIPEIREVTPSEFRTLVLENPDVIVSNRVASRQFGVLRYLPDQGKTLVYLSPMADFKPEHFEGLRISWRNGHYAWQNANPTNGDRVLLASALRATASARKGNPLLIREKGNPLLIREMPFDLKRQVLIQCLFSQEPTDRFRLIQSIIHPLEALWKQKDTPSVLSEMKGLVTRLDLVQSILKKQGVLGDLETRQVPRIDMVSVQEQVASEPEPESEDIQWLRTIDSCLSQHESVWTDMPAMVACIRAHVQRTGRPVFTNDEPMRLLLGYQDLDTGRTWKIRITDIKKTMGEDKLLGHAVRTVEGRLRLVNGSTS